MFNLSKDLSEKITKEIKDKTTPVMNASQSVSNCASCFGRCVGGCGGQLKTVKY